MKLASVTGPSTLGWRATTAIARLVWTSDRPCSGPGSAAGLTTASRPLKPPLSLPLPSRATPTGPNGVASEMLLSATSRTIFGSWNGLLLGGGRSLSIWPQLTLPCTSSPAQPHSPRDHAIDCEAAVELEAHLDDRVLGDEVGPLGIADDEVADLLGPEPDPVEMIFRLDPAPFELALEEVRGDRPPLDPDTAMRATTTSASMPMAMKVVIGPQRRAPNDDASLLRRAEALVSRPLIHRAF